MRNEIKRRFTVWQTRREMSSSSGTGGKRATNAYEISSEKNTTFNRTISAQGTPDLYQYPLSEIKKVPPSDKIEKGHSFENSGAVFERDSELDVKENKDSDQETEGDKESEGNSLVELNKDSVDKYKYWACVRSLRYEIVNNLKLADMKRHADIGWIKSMDDQGWVDV